MPDNNLDIKKWSLSDANTKTVKYVDRNSKRIIKEVIFTDKNGDLMFDDNEMTSITVWGYSESGQTAASRTVTDFDGDGYADDKCTLRGYKKNDRGEYVKVKEENMITGKEELEKSYLQSGDVYAAEELEKLKMQNINNSYLSKYELISYLRTIYERVYGDSFDKGIY